MKIDISNWGGTSHPANRTADINGLPETATFDAVVNRARPEVSVVELNDGRTYVVGGAYGGPAPGDYVRLNGSPAPLSLRVGRVAYITL